MSSFVALSVCPQTSHFYHVVNFRSTFARIDLLDVHADVLQQKAPHSALSVSARVGLFAVSEMIVTGPPVPSSSASSSSHAHQPSQPHQYHPLPVHHPSQHPHQQADSHQHQLVAQPLLLAGDRTLLRATCRVLDQFEHQPQGISLFLMHIHEYIHMRKFISLPKRLVTNVLLNHAMENVSVMQFMQVYHQSSIDHLAFFPLRTACCPTPSGPRPKTRPRISLRLAPTRHRTQYRQ
jgi:hypothetical protein